MVRFALVLIFVAICICSIGAEPIPFVLPWDDASPGPTNLSYLLEKPAGKRGFVRVVGEHLYVGGERLKLFGVNLTTSACFPEHEAAEKMAARMAKFGINCVRFHHMDAVWSDDVIFTRDKRSIDPKQLDKLDYLIYQLKKNGIYSNINLHVSREYPDMPEWPGHPDFYKGVDIFYPSMIEMQKQYARELLGHTNPYTKTRYADEPAIALVEINNEDGLLWVWSMGSFDDMPQEYATIFSERFRNWLRKQYESDEHLGRAWTADDVPLGDEILDNPDFSDGMRRWNLEIHGGAKASAGPTSDNTVIVNVGAVDGTNWHVQFIQPGISIKAGQYYTISFRAKADRVLNLQIALQLNRDPYSMLFHSGCDVDNEWQDYKYIYLSDKDDDDIRLNITNLGQRTGVLELGKLSIREGTQFDPISTNIADLEFIKKRDAGRYAPSVKRDWHRFLMDTEAEYWTEMYDFIKKDLGCKMPVIGTAVPHSPPSVQAKMDIVDSHAYWMHPVFPDGPWDPNNWYVKNEPMAGKRNGGTLGGLAIARRFGKPFTVTEYNHPAPNTYSSECFLLLSVFAGLQDWDGLFAYAYSESANNLHAGHITDFFSISQHPTQMAAVAVAALIFLRGDIKPAIGAQALELEDQKYLQIAETQGVFMGPQTFGLTGLEGMHCRIGLGTPTGNMKPVVPQRAEVVKSDTGEFVWDSTNGRVILDSPRSKAIIGSVSDEAVSLGDVEIAVEESMQNWAVITLTSTNMQPIDTSGSVLICATGYVENTDMGWKDAGRTTVGTNWGKAPALVEIIRAQITLPSKKLPKVWTLDEKGQKKESIPVQMRDEKAVFTIGKSAGSLWYLLER